MKTKIILAIWALCATVAAIYFYGFGKKDFLNHTRIDVAALDDKTIGLTLINGKDTSRHYAAGSELIDEALLRHSTVTKIDMENCNLLVTLTYRGRDMQYVYPIPQQQVDSTMEMILQKDHGVTFMNYLEVGSGQEKADSGYVYLSHPLWPDDVVKCQIKYSWRKEAGGYRWRKIVD